MMFSRTALTTAIAVLGLTAGSRTVQAQSPQHLDHLALELREQSRELYYEFQAHYSHVPHFRHLMSDSAEMYQLANHVHEVAHHGGGLYHLSDDVNKLDRLFHHVEGLVADMQRHTWQGVGHTHGDTRHVVGELRQMENTLHHLQSDLRALTQPYSQPYTQVGPSIRTRRSVQIRVPGFSFRFGH